MIHVAAPPEEVVTIAPHPKRVQSKARVRNFLTSLLYVLFGATAMMATFALLAKSAPYALLSAFLCLVLAFAIRVLKRGTNSATNPTRPDMVIYMTNEGLNFGGVAPVGPILWSDIAEVQSIRFLLFPTLRLKPHDLKTLYSHIAEGSEYLWMYRIPGGLGINTRTLGLSSVELAAQINAYRATHGV